MSSPPEHERVFSVRIVSLDYYMAPPIPDLDFCYSSFQGRNVEDVPVIRIYGSTPAGQKTCLHIHRALPYLYVPCSEVLLKNPEEGRAYIHVLSRAIEKALKYRSTSSKRQYVHGCNLVRAKKLYGYHLSEELFVKIYLYHPRDIARLATLLLDGAILNKSFQPYESHIPYLLQFLIDYNLYGMGHIHISSFKFRPPMPNLFTPKASRFKTPDVQEGSSNDGFGGVAIWLACTVPSALIWSSSNVKHDSLGYKTTHLRRQSVCALEVDSSVDDILNEKYKIYTSLSQTRSDVKLVQSLVPIWEEEYERSGLQEAIQSPGFCKPQPETVLRSFSHGLEYENSLSEMCIEAHNSSSSKIDVIELNEKLDQCIKSFANFEKPLGLINPLRPEGPRAPLMCPEENKNVNRSFGSLSNVDEEAGPFVVAPELHGLRSIDKKLPSSQKTGSESPKNLDTEALGLLSWFASSQAAEDLNTDDELVHEVILSPLFPTKSYEKALEMAHLDYESASQKECQDILDSVEDVLKSEGLKDQASGGNHDDCLVTASSGNIIPQVDGSSDDNSRTPEKCEFAEEHTNEKDGKRSKKRRSYQKSISLWGSLPLSSKWKDHPDSEAASHNSFCDDDIKNDSESSSSFVEGDTSSNASGAGTTSFVEKEGKILSSCSVRDLMRKRRFFRVEKSEPDRHLIRELSDLQKHGADDLSSKELVHHLFEEGMCFNMPNESQRLESSFTHQDAAGKGGEDCVKSCTNTVCTCEISRWKEEFSLQSQKTNSNFCDDKSVKRDLQEKTTSASSLIAIQKENIYLHDADKCVTNRDSKNILNHLPEVIMSREESYSKFQTYLLQSKTHRCGELEMGTSSSNPINDTCTYMHKRSTPAEYTAMTFSLRPPSKDQLDTICEELPGTSTCSLQSKECQDRSLNSHCCLDTNKHSVEDLPPFFINEFQDKRSVNLLPNQGIGILHQESGLGVPTHFQNDGLVLYILTHASSPPTSDSVQQWLVQQNSVDHAADPFLKSTNNFEVASEGYGGCPSGKSQVLLCEKDQINLQGFTEETSHSVYGSLETSQGNKPDGKNHASCITCSEPQVPRIRTKDEQQSSNWQEVSQISGPDEKSLLTPLSQIGFRDPASVGCGQQLTLISIEVLTESRGCLRPDPQFDAINIITLVIQEDTDHNSEIFVLICCNDEGPSGRNIYGIPGCKFILVSEESDLFEHFRKIVSSFDPDVLMGWEVQNASLGFLAQRAAHLGVSLLKNISRTPAFETKVGAINCLDTEKGVSSDMLAEPSVTHSALEYAIIEDDWGRLHSSGIHVGGRIVLNIWRLMRAEVKLSMYTVEAVAEEVLRRKVPFIQCRVLTHWFSSGPGQARFRCIEYIVERAKLNLQILNQLDMVNRTSELARVFGIDFFSVLSRGSQFRVESMLMRLAHTQNYLALSPGNQKVASQPAMECLPLVMEPESGFYADPVVVLDFQSLYPSMIIAYNLCFCTCLGKVSSNSGVLGVSSYSPDPQLLLELNQQLLLTPNGVIYAPPKVRKGVLPRLLEEILSTRIMVKKALKKLMPSQKVLQRIFNARQLALKLIANVTYGYTAAGFSGRMPCAELADSIVQCGRRTLETAISFVNGHDKWKARVIYGDTDSMFVLLKGRTMKEAFRIGNEIASAITAMNPYPVTLKLEKVYHPCFLLTKKRYVGYSYESPDQQKPTFDAKGIETVRRDSCPAVSKTLEQSLRILFEQQDISKVKTYLQRQWARILSGKVSLQDFVFAKEVRLGTYSVRASSLPPAAIVATKAMRVDPRAEPHYGQRIPYVVVHGRPGARLVDMVVDPLDLLEINSPYRVNDLYYINKQIIPALQRVFGLLGVDLKQWFSEIPRPVRPLLSKRRVFVSHPWSLQESGDNGIDTSRKAQLKRSTIDTYYISKHCTLCGELVQSSSYLCDSCSEKSPLVVAAVVGKTSRLEKEIQHLAAICRHCGGGDWIIESGIKCTSLACPVFYERRKVQRELQAISIFATESGFYPCCMAELF